MNENEMILIFSTNHLLLQKFLEDWLCLKDALAVLLKIEEGHLHIENDPKKNMKYIATECYQTNHQNVKMLRIVQKHNSLQLTCHDLAEEGKLLRRREISFDSFRKLALC